MLGALLRQDLLQADEITLELVALRSFAELEGERVLAVKNTFQNILETFFFTHLSDSYRRETSDCASLSSLRYTLRNLLPTTFLCFPSCQDYNCCFGWEAGRSMFAPECGDE